MTDWRTRDQDRGIDKDGRDFSLRSGRKFGKDVRIYGTDSKASFSMDTEMVNASQGLFHPRKHKGWERAFDDAEKETGNTGK